MGKVSSVSMANIDPAIVVEGKYVLSVKDDSLESWSRPQWFLAARLTLACVGILAGSIWLLTKADLPEPVRFVATTLAPAAGYKLLETGAVTSGKGKKGNGK